VSHVDAGSRGSLSLSRSGRTDLCPRGRSNAKNVKGLELNVSREINYTSMMVRSTDPSGPAESERKTESRKEERGGGGGRGRGRRRRRERGRGTRWRMRGRERAGRCEYHIAPGSLSRSPGHDASPAERAAAGGWNHGTNRIGRSASRRHSSLVTRQNRHAGWRRRSIFSSAAARQSLCLAASQTLDRRPLHALRVILSDQADWRMLHERVKDPPPPSTIAQITSGSGNEL
jgi:hypothetical protein